MYTCVLDMGSSLNVIIQFSSYLQTLSLIQVLLSVFYRILRRKKQIEPWIQYKGTIHQIYRDERRLAVCGEGAGCAQRAQKCAHGAKDTQGAESAEKHYKCRMCQIRRMPHITARQRTRKKSAVCHK